MVFNFDLTSNISSFKCIRIFAYRIFITVSVRWGHIRIPKALRLFLSQSGQVFLNLISIVEGYVVFPFRFKELVTKKKTNN